MKPQRHLALAKGIGQALAETQLAALNGPGTAAALGATASGRFEEVGHAARISRL
jgi:predicted N-acetyltransferase YhbS